MAIITKSHETELKILNVTCDMGSCNRAMWREFGIQVGKTGQPVFSVPHPVEPKLKLHFMANVPHVVKNIKVALVNGQQIDVDGRYVSMKPVEALAKFQENRELKIAPKLKLKQLQAPSHFHKIRSPTLRTSSASSSQLSPWSRSATTCLNREEYSSC